MTKALQSARYPWVCRTDVKGYYGSMNKKKLLACVNRQVHDPVLRSLIAQYVHYTVEEGGEFYTPEKGIARGCALSPLMGALYLAQMEEHFSRETGIYYARYMDDVVILAKTRWQLRRHVRALNGFFEAGEVEQHPDKTFIGRTERGFDWMGAQMGDAGVEGIAHRAMANYGERLRRLYEQFRGTPAVRQARMSAYRKHWARWAFFIIVSASPTAHAALVSVSQTDLNDQIAAQTSLNADGSRSGKVTISLKNGDFKSAGFSRLYDRIDYAADPVQAYLTGEMLKNGQSSNTTLSLGKCTLTIGAGYTTTVGGLATLYSGGLAGTFDNLTITTTRASVGSASAFAAPPAEYQNKTQVYASPTSGYLDGGRSVVCSGTMSVSFNVDIPAGAAVAWNNISATFISRDRTDRMASIGVLTYNTSTPPEPPAPISPPPVCNWAAGPKASQLDFGTVSNDPTNGQWSLIKALPAIDISAVCKSTGKSLAAEVAVSAYTTATLAGSNDVVRLQSDEKKEMGLLLAIASPATAPAGVKFFNRNGQLFYFGTSDAPKLWWTWQVAARSAAGETSLSAVQLTPQLRQWGPGNWSKDMYDKDLTATVVLRLVTK
ncbi:reverse transcriptase domain-containing protein [Enterobacter asburiae]|uniref:reverse transcriptase domain-containing protein n=1 Tax=Enterobacter asburiae TaxID=61645 RepID=UPI0021D32EBB|nr:reverse transcriptase domain-containing protein [Enterobacter asburiae]MCU6244089.1 hypothetical protein [Enterobacter asburiae]